DLNPLWNLATKNIGKFLDGLCSSSQMVDISYIRFIYMFEFELHFNLSRNLTSAPHRRRTMPDLCKDLVYEILSRCPVKSLLRFMSVSKQWSEIISSRRFTSDHLRAHRRAAASHLISYHTSAPILTVNQYEGEGRPFKLDLPIRHPGDVSTFIVRSSCRGLICAVVSTVSGVKMFVLNPITRAVKELPACPGVTQQMISLSLVSVGLGYDPATDDYKVLVVILPKRTDSQSQQPCSKISILSLKTNVWDQSIEDPAPYNAVGNPSSLDGCIYWL
uniref:F-box domain-containing protein n=1 Tax=Kalanchoe fedtschenkoi TaxID=63787 RepID=A0A7N0TSL2_KALFE